MRKVTIFSQIISGFLNVFNAGWVKENVAEVFLEGGENRV